MYENKIVYYTDCKKTGVNSITTAHDMCVRKKTQSYHEGVYKFYNTENIIYLQIELIILNGKINYIKQNLLYIFCLIFLNLSFKMLKYAIPLRDVLFIFYKLAFNK